MAIFRTLILLALAGAGAVESQGPILEDSVQIRLNDSPRHQEWVKVKSGDHLVEAFLVFPEVPHKALAVLVIHENKGLTDWVRGVADRLAEEGYIAIAPDLLSGKGPKGGGTSSFQSEDEARTAIYTLDEEQVLGDLDAVADYVVGLPAANGEVVVGGFCWGGSRSFLFATHRKDLGAAFVFYGEAPESPEAIGRIACPVYGFYGGTDNRINSGIPAVEALMAESSKRYEPVIYEGAGHAFMRKGEASGAAEAERASRAAAWNRWLALLKSEPANDESESE